MRIRFLTSIAGTNYSYRRGDVENWKNEKEAKNFIEKEIAAPLTEAENAVYEEHLAATKAADEAAEKRAKATAAAAKKAAAEKKAAEKKDDAAKGKTQRRAPGRPPNKKKKKGTK